MDTKQKIITIVGPTASGKTSLAIHIAKKFDGEVISADSRQVYRGLDIGTEKVTQEETQGISHHLIDIREPHDTYTASDFVHDADVAICNIAEQKKLPIVAGGTLFYVDALLGNTGAAPVPPNESLRDELETKTTEKLAALLKEKDSACAQKVDLHNRRRLIRALEIIDALGHVPEPQKEERYDACIIGIGTEPDVLRERINNRLDETLQKGLVEETKKLLASGVPRERLNEIGLEYRVVLRHLDEDVTYEEMVTELQNKVWQYAKRQMTWLRKMENVRWIKSGDTKTAEKIVQEFLT